VHPIRARSLAAAALALGLGSCSPESAPYAPAFADEPEGQPVYTFAVHPLHNPALLYKIYGPLVDHLNAKLPGIRFRLVASRDYAAFGRRIAASEFDFALPNPYQAILAERAGYRIFGKVGDDDGFRGLIVVRKDSDIARIGDLRGKTISYPARTAVAGTMMPQYFIATHGVKIAQTRTVYVGSMESSLESVRTGASDAGAVWPDPWNKYVRAKPREAAALVVRWRTPPLVNNALVVRRRLPAPLAAKVLAALQDLGRTPEGRQLLETMSIRSFEPASAATYAPVRKFLADYAREVGPLPATARRAE
jgi:phosphonate transport system substrate-binding protein